jgi:hypothetical protein
VLLIELCVIRSNSISAAELVDVEAFRGGGRALPQEMQSEYSFRDDEAADYWRLPGELS